MSTVSICLQDALELEERLVVEADVREVTGLDPGRLQAAINGVPGERCVTFLTGQPLCLRRGHDVAVGQDAGSAIMVEGRDPDDVLGCVGQLGLYTRAKRRKYRQPD